MPAIGMLGLAAVSGFIDQDAWLEAVRRGVVGGNNYTVRIFTN